LQCKPPPNPREIREELMRVSKAAASVDKGLQALYDSLYGLTPESRKWLDDRRAPLNIEVLPAQGARFDELSAVAARLAAMLKHIEKGGAPKMRAWPR
jgi:hypothetical protein